MQHEQRQTIKHIELFVGFYKVAFVKLTLLRAKLEVQRTEVASEGAVQQVRKASSPIRTGITFPYVYPSPSRECPISLCSQMKELVQERGSIQQTTATDSSYSKERSEIARYSYSEERVKFKEERADSRYKPSCGLLLVYPQC